MPPTPTRRLSCRSTPPRIRRYRLRRRPGFLSPFWVRLSDSQGFTSYREQEEWTLLLSARHLPFRLWKADGKTHCFIPALLRDVARTELRLYKQEEAARTAASRQPAAPARSPPSPRPEIAPARRSCLAFRTAAGHFLPPLSFPLGTAGKSGQRTPLYLSRGLSLSDGALSPR